MKEKRDLEFKQEITNTFLKTVSAYANFEGGEIMFGITDKTKETIGIENPDDACLDIENKINDNIKPSPTYSLTINRKTNVITLNVEEGLFKPYLYKGKAYKRNNTSTIEVSHMELKRLVLLGENLYFDELPIIEIDLTFNYFFKLLKEKLNVQGTDKDTLRTMGLYNSNNQFNNAALLLSDDNNFPGIDIVKFGDNINEIAHRETISNASILEQLDKAESMFDLYYKVEETVGMRREDKYLVPKGAFREAVANAFVHREWDTNAKIRISMYKDKIEVFSPGGLPIGLKKEEYLNGYISTLRNPTIGNVFFRLKIIEMFGTGIRKIKEEYIKTAHKPTFELTENSVVIILPSESTRLNLTSDEEKIVNLLSSGIRLASSELVMKSGFSKDKVVRLVNELIDKRYIEKEGVGRGTKYYLV